MRNVGAALHVVDAGPPGAPTASPDPGSRLSPHRERIVDATLVCLAFRGTLKTTVDDIARQAGLSRATVYRAFPAGRDEVLAAVVDTEMARLFSALGVRLGEARDLSQALVAGIVEASSRIRGHAALGYLVAHEPEMVLGHLAFEESDRLLATASRFTAPFLARWMSPAEAGRVAEWATRIVLSYAIAPSELTDLTDPAQTTRLVETFVVPGIRALNASGAHPPIDITPFGFGSDPSTGSPTPASRPGGAAHTDQDQLATASPNRIDHPEGDRT